MTDKKKFQNFRSKKISKKNFRKQKYSTFDCLMQNLVIIGSLDCILNALHIEFEICNTGQPIS